MLNQILIIVAFCCAFSYGAVFDPYSRRYGIFKDTIDTLLDVPSGSSSCKLVSGLYALSSKASLTITQNSTYIQWIQKIEVDVIKNNIAYTTKKSKFIKIAALFEQFQLQQSAIYSKIQYYNISTWGPFETFVSISTEWNMQSALELIVASSANGNCKLFDLLLIACQGDIEKHTSLSSFIESDLKMIVKNKTKTQVDIIKEINQAFKTKFFIGTKSSWISYFYALNLNGYFSFSQWCSVAVTYERQSNIDSTLTGQGMNCPFILSLNSSLSSTSYTLTQKSFIKQLTNYFIQQWNTVITIEARINIISMRYSESIDLSYSNFGFLNSIDIKGFGSFWNFIIFSCQRTHIPPSCGCPTDPPTDAPTIPPTVLSTNIPTDPAADPKTDSPTNPPTIPPTASPTSPPTNPPTDKPIYPTTDPPTDPPTNPPIDHATEPPQPPDLCAPCLASPVLNSGETCDGRSIVLYPCEGGEFLLFCTFSNIVAETAAGTPFVIGDNGNDAYPVVCDPVTGKFRDVYHMNYDVAKAGCRCF